MSRWQHLRYQALQTANCGPRTPIIAITVSAMVGDRECFLASRRDDYVPNPTAGEIRPHPADDLVQLAMASRWSIGSAEKPFLSSLLGGASSFRSVGSDSISCRESFLQLSIKSLANIHSFSVPQRTFTLSPSSLAPSRTTIASLGRILHTCRVTPRTTAAVARIRRYP